ncbi:MAG: ATP-binding protein, partial [Bacteroidota bacterium]
GGIQDITERKLSERLMLEKNITSKAAQIQEEALTELSFQIRTPLSSIVNLLFLMEKTNVSTAQATYLKDLKTSADDLSIAVNNLLNFSVMVSDTVKVEEEEFNLRTFLQSIRNVVQIKADAAKLRLSVEADERLPEKIISDPKKLTQILYNLLDNAIRYTPRGGKITLKVSQGETQGAKSTVVFTVKDNGMGLSSGKIKDLLEADRLLESPTAEKNKKRSLGIAIVVKLAKTLGAAFDIQSHEGNGAAFSINLPVRIAWQTRLDVSDVPEMPLKILLVEDHFLNQLATKKVLTSWSPLVTVDIAENGAVGVQKFRENGYDLILMDIQMPVMNGLDAARKIREFSDVPIIALTANSTKQEQDKCFEIKM